MSEHIKPHSNEHFKPQHHVEHQPHPEHHQTHHNHEADKHAEKTLREQAETISHTAKQEAISGQEYQSLGNEHEQPASQFTLVYQELQSISSKRTLTRIRKDLPAPQRVLSKVIHQPVVDAVSEIGSKTIARPSGILTGSIIAFIGTSAFLYICRHYGYTYNYLLFALLFVGGFCLGLIIELGIFTFRRRSGSI